MRSSALAGFIASAVLVSGSAGFASTFLVGPYLGEHGRLQSPKMALLSTTAPMDPLAVVQTSAPAKPALEGEAPASQTAHRLRHVENTTPAADTTAQAPTAPSAPATPAANGADAPGPITEDAFAHTSSPSAMPTATGGPLIATETTSAMISSKLEDGEPVLTLRIAPIVTPTTAAAAEPTDPDNAVEPTVISAQPTEQALATTAVAITAQAPATEPVAPPPAEPAHPRAKPAPEKPALQAAERAPEPTRHAKPRTPARVSTTAQPAREIEPQDAPAEPDPLNAPFIPATPEQPTGAATGTPASMTPPPAQAPSTGGPTPLTMPQ